MRLKERITKGSKTPYDKAVAIQAWFTTLDRFKYTLQVPQTQSPAALIQFLTKTRSGYCQQFAFGMAVLARLAGIPSRVVVGYTQGSFSGNDNWQVKTSDAHAWPELYFPGVGWLRFEPTPPNTAGLPGQATAVPPPYSTPLAAEPNINPETGLRVSTNPSPESTQGSKSQSGLNKLKKTAPTGAGGATAGRHGTPLILPVLIALLALILIAPATTRALGRRWRWWRAHDDVARAHVAWHELRNDLTDHRIPYRASERPVRSPAASPRRWAWQVPSATRWSASPWPRNGPATRSGPPTPPGSRRTRPWCGAPSRVRARRRRAGLRSSRRHRR